MTMAVKIFLSVLLVISIPKTCYGRPSGTTVPCNQAADILFIVDTSSSIWPGYYKDVKNFLKDVISSFKIGPDPLDSRVGVLTFSTREHLEFHLNKHQNVEDVLKSIDGIKFRGGDTYTHRALEFASKVMLTPEHGSREGVAKLIVVLTDGKSANAKRTTESVATIKAKGADVFAIGVGNGVDFQELHDIASLPSQHFVFQVTDFRALDSIKNAFTQSTCEVLTSTVAPSTTTIISTTTTTTTTTPRTTSTATPTTTTVTSTTSTRKPFSKTTTAEQLPNDEPDFEEGCKGKPADIYFLLDSSSSVWIGHFHDRVLPFVRDLVSSFQISPLHTRVGLVTFSNDVNHEFGLSAHDNLKSLLAAIQPEHVEYLTGGTNTGDAIEYVSNMGFGAGESRKGVAQIIITVTDGLSQIPKRTAQAAAEAREKGVFMFAVGVGKDVDEKELADISSNPDEDFVFSVDDFKALSSVTQLLAQKTCKAVSKDDSSKPHQLFQCSKMSSNVVFVYDNLNSISASNMIVQELISDFTHDAAVYASGIKVGILTQPCIGGTTPLQSIGEFQKSLVSIRASNIIGYTELVRQLRTETFNSVPRTEQRVAVMIIDDKTSNLDMIQKEILRLKFTNVKVIVVAVGKVEEVFIEQMASIPIRDHVLRVDSYDDMRHTKLDILSILCGKNLDDIFNLLESDNQDETTSPRSGDSYSLMTGADSASHIDEYPVVMDNEENRENQEVDDITNTISVPGSVKHGLSEAASDNGNGAVSDQNGESDWIEHVMDANTESEDDDGSEDINEQKQNTESPVTIYYTPN